MENVIVIAVIVLIVSLAAWYVIRAKKNGAKCIGCPSGCSCGDGKRTAAGGTDDTCSSCHGCSCCSSCSGKDSTEN